MRIPKNSNYLNLEEKDVFAFKLKLYFFHSFIKIYFNEKYCFIKNLVFYIKTCTDR
jgi:hypothetical protein